MNFYYASRFKNIKVIKPGTQISIWPHIVHNLNLYHLKNNKVWENDELEKDYLLTPKIYFKKNREPHGVPYLYSGFIENKNVIKEKNYPYIFANKSTVKVKLVNPIEHFNLITLSELLEDWFFNTRYQN